MRNKLIIIALTLVLLTATLCGCGDEVVEGGSAKTDTIVFQSLFRPFVYPFEGGTTLSLNLDCYVGAGVPPMANQSFVVTEKEIPNLFLDYNQYESSHGIVALYETLKANQENSQKNPQKDNQITNIELIGDYIVISTVLPDLRYVMIVRSSKHSGDSSGRGYGFDYMPLQGFFFEQDIFDDIPDNHWRIEGENIATYIPYHLFDDHSLFYQYAFGYYGGLRKNHNLSHQLGHYYEIHGDISDFKAFYESLDLYEITQEDSRLILEGTFHVRDGTSYIREEGMPASEVVSPVETKMFLDFKEESGKRYVAYSRGQV